MLELKSVILDLFLYHLGIHLFAHMNVRNLKRLNEKVVLWGFFLFTFLYNTWFDINFSVCVNQQTYENILFLNLSLLIC